MPLVLRSISGGLLQAQGTLVHSSQSTLGLRTTRVHTPASPPCPVGSQEEREGEKVRKLVSMTTRGRFSGSQTWGSGSACWALILLLIHWVISRHEDCSLDLRSLVKSMWLTPHLERASREESRKTGALQSQLGALRSRVMKSYLSSSSCQAQISLSHSQGLGEGWEEVSKSSQESRTAEA